MSDLQEFADILDSNRARRARELSDLKTRVSLYDSDPFQLGSKMIILFAYAHWEGFYNECVDIYVSHLGTMDVETTSTSWLMLVGNIDSDFASLSARNHSYEAKIEFVEALKMKLSNKFSQFDRKCLLARSNLDFEKLRMNFRIIGCDINPIQKLRNRLDKEIVAWRHAIAHGGSPELNTFAAQSHLELASNLMLALSDAFQLKMLSLQT